MNKPMRLPSPRLLLFGLVVLLLLTGGWAALLRAGWSLPALRPTLIGMHGPLMMGGLFGTLIALERAVAVASLTRRKWHWSYLAPALGACGGLLLILVGAETLTKLCLLASSVLLAWVYAYTATTRHYWSLHTGIMLVGAVAWVGGNVLWFLGYPLYILVHGWIAFLVLTIVGERLELSRVRRLTQWDERLLVGSVSVYVLGVLLTVVSLDIAVRAAGFGQLLIALWLLRFDIAGHSVRQAGLTRYIAVCLLTGYIWLIAAGVLGMVSGAVYAGFHYDAVIHAVLAGFIFSMIFGHAPLIIPALVGHQISYSATFYLPLVLLHFSVLLREYSDLTLAFEGRKWAGMTSAVAVVLFMLLMVYRVMYQRRATRQSGL